MDWGCRARRAVLMITVFAALATAATEIPPAYLLEWGAQGTGNEEFTTIDDVAVHSSGFVAVSDQILNRVQQFDTRGNYIRQWGGSGTAASEFDRPWGVAVDRAGNIYVSDRENHRVQKFDNEGTFLLMWGGGVVSGTDTFEICTSSCKKGTAGGNPGQFNLPTGLTVDGGGNVYVANWGNFRVQKYQSDGTYLTYLGTDGTAEGEFFGGPADVAVDSDGNVYTCEETNARVQVFDRDGNFVRMWGFGVDDGTPELQVCTGGCEAGQRGNAEWQFYSAETLAVDSDGNVYVADFANDRVLKFDHWGKPLVWWSDGNGALDKPVGIDIEGLSLYLGDRGNFRIIKYGGPYFETHVGEPDQK